MEDCSLIIRRGTQARKPSLTNEATGINLTIDPRFTLKVTKLLWKEKLWMSRLFLLWW